MPKSLRVILFSITLLAMVACSTSTRTTQTETTYSDSPTVSKTETTTTSSDDHEDQGILGSAVGIVGDIIAFPFRVVGALIDVIF